MANSSIIGSAKNKIIKEFIKNSDLITAIDSTNLNPNRPSEYVNTHIFNYHQNPYTISDVMTFITVQVHIPRTFDTNKVFVVPQVEIWIISHERHMKVTNVPKVNMNRNDYISMLIDNQLNGQDGFGIGELHLVSNIEGSFQQDYLFRKMIFEGKDINDSLCGEG